MVKIDLPDAARRLKAVRESEGLTKAEFADMLGVDRSTYIKIEDGAREIRVPMALRLAELFGISLDFLYRGNIATLSAEQAAKIRPRL